MIENCYKSVTDAIKYRNQYPVGGFILTMENIVKEAFKWVEMNHGELPNTEYTLTYLTERDSKYFFDKLYLLVIKNTLTKEYVVSTITYKYNKRKSENSYKFEVLEYEGR